MISFGRSVIFVVSFWAILLTTNNVVAQAPVKVGTKLFTESVIIGDITQQLLIEDGVEVEFYKQLGGTRILWNALLSGEIDIYPDYTGTIIEEMLGGGKYKTITELNQKLEEYGLQSTQSLGFNNTYALGMIKAKANKLGLQSISDLRAHPQLKYGFSNEFINRADGWACIQQNYRLAPTSVTGLDHDLAYRGLQGGSTDVIDLYSTDAEIDYYQLKVLKDDLQFFPDYQAVILYRKELEVTHPKAVKVLKRLEGKISEEEMVAMNAAVKIDGREDAEVASAFIQEAFGVQTEFTTSTLWSRFITNTLGHLYLVGISLGLAILFAIPLGIIAAKDRKSTRLNSSHVRISYAVFCLKKKKKIYNRSTYEVKNINLAYINFVIASTSRDSILLCNIISYFNFIY